MTHSITAPARWRTLAYPRRTTPRPRNLDALWRRAQGRVRRLRRRPASYLERARRIAALTPDTPIDEIAARFRLARETPRDVDHALAHLASIAHAALGLTPHPVQIAAALALLESNVVELATGEGKTLSAAMAGAVHAWRGRGCHLITANDYLAARDARWMRPLFDAASLRVAAITQDTPHHERARTYAADVTYTTAKEVAADLLRDRLARPGDPGLTSTLARALAPLTSDPPPTPLLRGLACAIVDEADSVLIDDAATPLIISSQAANHSQIAAVRRADAIARSLDISTDFRVDARHQEVNLTSAGRRRIHDAVPDARGVWASERRSEELVCLALTAHHIFLRDRQYIIDDARAVPIDESTGRTMPDRTWRAGLHQAIEVKEGLPPRPDQHTVARISFQRFFSMYEHLCGMTGTARESRAEFWSVYALSTVVLPTHRPCRRTVHPMLTTRTASNAIERIIEETRSHHEAGRPVLIGTSTISESERLSAALTDAGLEHRVLNARHHALEAEIVAEAGRRGRITVATNMAGRGTDIVLGPGVTELGGLHVIAASAHDSKRIERQLLGRAARQGDPGSGRVIVSLEDETIRRYAPGAARFPRAARQRLVRLAQRRAAGLARRRRRHVMETDERLDESLAFAGPEH